MCLGASRAHCSLYLPDLSYSPGKERLAQSMYWGVTCHSCRDLPHMSHPNAPASMWAIRVPSGAFPGGLAGGRTTWTGPRGEGRPPQEWTQDGQWSPSSQPSQRFALMLEAANSGDSRTANGHRKGWGRACTHIWSEHTCGVCAPTRTDTQSGGEGWRRLWAATLLPGRK